MVERQIASKQVASPADSRERHPDPTSPILPPDDAVLEEIYKAIQSVRFGAVQIIVQDGRVVQIDKTEKIRLV